jgi:hypothetical protein
MSEAGVYLSNPPFLSTMNLVSEGSMVEYISVDICEGAEDNVEISR